MIALAAALAGSAEVATFDHVVKRVAEAHPDPGFTWSDEALALRSRARKAKSAAALRKVLEELLATLGDSHYAVFAGRSTDPMLLGRPGLGAAAGGTAGFAVTSLDGAVLVTRVLPGGPADEAGLGVGTEITRIADHPLAPVVAELFAAKPPSVADVSTRLFVRSHADGPIDGTVSVGLADGSTLEIPRVADGVYVMPPMGRVPAITGVWDERQLPVSDGVTARYVAIESFAIPVVSRFTEAMAAAREADGALILDLRGNPGGVQDVGRGVAGFLVDRRTTLGRTRSKMGELDLVVHPRPASQRFTGPVAILVDRASASTSEFLAAGLGSSGRARVFGERTAGMALPSVFEALPNGDVLQLAFADYTPPDGQRIEGIGYTPQVEIEVTRQTLSEDATLEAALSWLRSLEIPR